MNTNSRNNRIVYHDDTTAYVTKTFKSRACIFGTFEFELWQEYRKQFPEAKMLTKTVKRNPDKKTTRNMTYEKMGTYIRTLDDKDKLLAEFKLVKERSKVQANPYQYVLGWFEKRLEGYDTYNAFFDNSTEDSTNESAAENVAMTADSSADSKITAFNSTDKAVGM